MADDLLAGLIATELEGDKGWHPANPAAGNSLDANGLPAFTDGVSAVGDLTGLLKDFPGDGMPTKRLQFDFYAVDNTEGQMRDPFDGVNRSMKSTTGCRRPLNRR